jgi:hypothetical protein
MWPRLSLVILISSTATVFAALYTTYRLVDPLPPRHLVIAAGMAGSGYENIAKRYAKILARHGVELEIRNSAGAVEDLNLLRDPATTCFSPGTVLAIASACATLINRIPCAVSVRSPLSIAGTIATSTVPEIKASIDRVESRFTNSIEASNASIAFRTSNMSDRKAIPGMPLATCLPRSCTNMVIGCASL